MELNRKLCAMRRKLSQRYWLDDSLGCCLLMWYCPFNFPFNFHYNFQFYFRKFRNFILFPNGSIFETKVSKLPPSPSAKL